MAKRQITAQQREEIKTLAKRANERIRTALSGQKAYLEFFAIQKTGKKRFSSATKNLTYAQAQQRLKELNRFLEAKTTTKKGWKALKRQQVAAANQRWKSWGYDLTDAELALILQQIDTKDKKAYYQAVDKVQAAKYKSGGYELEEKEIAAAIDEQITEQQAALNLIKARGKK